jgi:hypothetical protein
MKKAKSDPILEAIDEHLGVIQEVAVAYPKSPSNPELSELCAMEGYAALCVVRTAPTTMAGVRALEAHLDVDRSVQCLRIIRNQWLTGQPNCDVSAGSIAAPTPSRLLPRHTPRLPRGLVRRFWPSAARRDNQFDRS